MTSQLGLGQLMVICEYNKKSQNNSLRGHVAGMLHVNTYIFGGEVQNSNAVLNLVWHV